MPGGVEHPPWPGMVFIIGYGKPPARPGVSHFKAICKEVGIAVSTAANSSPNVESGTSQTSSKIIQKILEELSKMMFFNRLRG